MSKRTFYAVAMTIFTDGRVIIRKAGTTEAYFKPKTEVKRGDACNRWVDWFESEAEAEEWIKLNTK